MIKDIVYLLKDPADNWLRCGASFAFILYHKFKKMKN